MIGGFLMIACGIVWTIHTVSYWPSIDSTTAAGLCLLCFLCFMDGIQQLTRAGR